jgi:hypothetical protein
MTIARASQGWSIAPMRAALRARTVDAMYVIVIHQFQDTQTAFARGERLVMNEGAPPGVRGLQFYPATDGSTAACLWESDSVEAIQAYVDSTLGDSSVNTCFEVDSEQAFAEQPLGLRTPAAIRG